MKKLSDQSKRMIFMGVVIMIAITVLILAWKYYAAVVILVGLGCWWIYDRTQEQKQMQQQQLVVNRQVLWSSALQTVFAAAVKFSDVLSYKCPQLPQDIISEPAVVNINGLPTFQFHLVKKTTNASDEEALGQVENLLQSGMNTELKSGRTPNIPFPAWKAADGKIWPLFTILAIRDEPLYLIIQVLVVDNDVAARFLTSQKYGRHNPPPTSHSDPDF